MRRRKRKFSKFIRIVAFAILCFVAGVASSAFKVGTNSWVETLVQNHLLRGRVHVELESVKRFEIDELLNALRAFDVTDIDRSLDDPIVKDYYLVHLVLSTGSTPIEAPLEVELDLESAYTKIIDAISRVQKPNSRRISVRDSLLRRHKWVRLATSNNLQFSWNSELEGVAGFNVYRSFDKELGYGRINAETIREASWSSSVYHASDLNPVFYRISTVSVSGSESELSEVIESPNIAPLISFTEKDKEVKPDSLSETLIKKSADYSSVRWSFDSGIEQGVEINLYAIVKVAPFGSFSPRVSISGSKNTLSSTRGFGGVFQYITPVREMDTARRRITPEIVSGKVFGETVVLHLQGLDDSDALRYKVYRSGIREVGIWDNLGDEVNDVIVHRGEVEFHWEERMPSLMQKARISNPISIFDVKAPTPLSEINAAAEESEIPPPTNARMYFSTTSNGVFLVDNPGDEIAEYTYTVFVFNDRNEVSAPVVVNISLSDAFKEASFRFVNPTSPTGP